MIAAVTADIVASRQLPDRAAAQRHLDQVISRVEQDMPLAVRALAPTAGDEQQGVYPTLDSALAATLLLRLALPEELDLRFGIGLGSTVEISSAGRSITEGSAWWAARTAIDFVHALEKRKAPRARTWAAASEEPGDVSDAELRRTNAYLLARDELIGQMSGRTRRLAYGRCLGFTQKELARAEGVSQSAVSQALSTGGASAITEGFALLNLG